MRFEIILPLQQATSSQRTRWFMTGLKSGDVASCDPFRTTQLRSDGSTVNSRTRESALEIVPNGCANDRRA